MDVTTCPVYRSAQKGLRLAKGKDPAINIRLTKANRDALACNSPRGIKALYVLPPSGCFANPTPIIVFGNGSVARNGNLQHATIAGHTGLPTSEAGKTFWGFRIEPLSFIFSSTKETSVHRDGGQHLLISVWEGHQETIQPKEGKIRTSILTGEIEAPTQKRLRTEHVYGYLLPSNDGTEMVEPWVISATAGINPTEFPWAEAPDLLNAIARQASPDFMLFSFFTKRIVYANPLASFGCIRGISGNEGVSCEAVA